MINQIKNLFNICKDWFLWLAPISLFLLAIIIPTKLFNVDFLKFVEVLAWPITILTSLFFFKKVFTYLFFSMDEFNFFGLRGHLRNINDVIIDEVNKKFAEKEADEERKINTEKLNLEISKKETMIKDARGNAEENLKLAKSVLDEWKKSIEQKDKIISEIEKDNKRLNEILSSVSQRTFIDQDQNAFLNEAQTDGPILEETKN